MAKFIDTRYRFSEPNVTIKFTSIDGAQYELNGKDLAGDLLSVNTSKNINQIAGTWDMEFVARTNLKSTLRILNPDKSTVGRLTYYKLFQLMSLVDIYIDGKEVMLGTVDNVRRSMSMDSDGSPMRTVKVRGRDLGGLLLDHKVWYDKNPETSAERENFILVSGYKLFSEVFADNVYVILEKIYKTWFDEVLNKTITINDASTGTQKLIEAFQWADGQRMDQKLTCSKTVGKGLSVSAYSDFYSVNFKNWNFEGNMFEMLKTFTIPPFNELFVDTGGAPVSLHRDGDAYLNQPLTENQCHVIFRPSPFDDKTITSINGLTSRLDISDLPGHTIDDNLITGKDLGFSKDKVYTMYESYPMANLVDVSSGKYYVPPLYDEVALKRYGHIPLEVPVDGWDVGNDEKVDFTTASKNLQKILYSWFRNNDKYLTGSFKFKGNSEVRIGHRIDYKATRDGIIDEPEEEGYYYVTGVDQSWNYKANTYSTTARVERGTSNELKKDFNKTAI